MVRFWDPTYRCFTFNEVDMVPTIKEYSTIFHYDFRDPLRIYWKQNVNFWGCYGKGQSFGTIRICRVRVDCVPKSSRIYECGAS
ncbi:hypothetical protein Golax_005285 [Gossypium laxum]|uniref:DUF7745 domain-containing protein n=1 Tax=Gossypium laxum TaxID=34288 RepID=A0A7J9A073_9ROSI|nr:hypothetical protein [Gossypium laxum]